MKLNSVPAIAGENASVTSPTSLIGGLDLPQIGELHGMLSDIDQQESTSNLENRDRFLIRRQIACGPDGVCYEAECQRDRRLKTLHSLSGAAKSELRLAQIEQRLRHLTAIAHRSMVRVDEIDLQLPLPRVVLEKIDGPTLSQWNLHRASLNDRLVIAGKLASIIVDLHRVDICIGHFDTNRIWIDADLQVRLDLTQLNTLDSLQEISNQPHRSYPFDDPASDIRQLAEIIKHLIDTGTSTQIIPATSARYFAALNHLLKNAIVDAVDHVALPQEILQRVIDAQASLQGPAALPVSEATNEWDLGDAEKTGEMLASEVLPNFAATLPDALRAMPSIGDLLGRYRIDEKLGEGGMGTVYRASDTVTGTAVAIKVLSRLKLKPNSIARFRKEARLLAAVRNPYVTNLIAVNEEGDFTYIVLEFIDGVDLKRFLKTSGPLDQRRALSIASDVARALVDAHEQGIIHRDIKPENILVLRDSLSVKLTDFGIARHIDQSESLAVTQAGSMLGTPIYMSPEQCRAGADVSTQTDIYSLGITLYEMVTGRPPFLSDDPMQLATMHCFQTPQRPSDFNPLISDDACAIIQKCLAKRPEDRYADAAHLLRQLDRCLRGESSAIELHPCMPVDKSDSIFDVQFQWILQSPSESLWHYVANTERLNRAIGLPAVDYENQIDAEGRVRRFGSFKLGLIKVRWEEHPFEWVEGKRMGVLRQFDGGPFKWFLSTVELERLPDNRTQLRHRIRVEPRNWIGRMMVRREIDVKARASLEKVYHRIDEALQHHTRSGDWIDAFEEPERLKSASAQRLQQRLDRLISRGVSTDVASKLGEFIASGPAQEVAKIHPLALAKRLGVEDSPLVDACLVAATEGILNLGWDILCPTCRVAADWQPTLKDIQSHAHCDACNIDFSTELSDALELVFRTHNEIRITNVGKYCIGGPGHSPHVVAQVRLSAGERMELELALPFGQYVIRGPRLPNPIALRVQATGASSHADLTLRQDPTCKTAADLVLRAGKQVIVITNDFHEEHLVRIERTVPRQDVITAAQASCLPMFRTLFPSERMTSDRMINAQQVTLLVTEIANANEIYASSDDAEAFQIVRGHHEFLEHHIGRHRGAVVKTVGDGVVAAFNEMLDAVDAAWELQSSILNSDSSLALKLNVGIHCGTAIVTTTNDRLDYFGAVARIAADLPRYADGEVVLTEAIFSDPLVSQRLRTLGSVGRIRAVEIAGQSGQIIQCYCIG